eukprot:1979623-Amphidinium_carterae.1
MGLWWGFCWVFGWGFVEVNQYRDDIRGMTEMVSSKMEMMHAVATLLIATAAALSCAGRIGMRSRNVYHHHRPKVPKPRKQK